MPTIRSCDFLAILRMLSEHGVDYIVVGGVGAVLHGAPLSTFDLDVVHARTPDNIERLLRALEALDAHYRGSSGPQLLMTRFGPLDLLGAVGKGSEYGALIRHSEEMDLGGGVQARVLSLEWLIQLKEETAADKDKAVLPVLRRTLEEKSRGGGA